ncbi:MAG: hypothetical protein H6Q86_5544 [candidate division NC10 bacterium]|nr:hypothetical protein [candidate division NC10 bacterium]
MEYLLLGGVTLLICGGVAALVLQPPARIGRRSSTDSRKNPGARRTDRPRRSRRGRKAVTPPVPSPAPVSPGLERLPPAVSASRQAIPSDGHDNSAVSDDSPYSPQELRNLLERRPPASPRAS